ncbi:hypothetical protein [Clostridium butyricum]
MHNKILMKVSDCRKEIFENENRQITVYSCKYCNKDVLVMTNHINAKFDLSKAFKHEE